ncbi:MAG TPA: hypothetical protein ENH65_14775 [Candidatus Aminicenantes bacterium]|nr:hypothetical protein [Candidatus Aminicenantes bacterium]
MSDKTPVKSITVTIQEDGAITGEVSQALVEAQGALIVDDITFKEAKTKRGLIKTLIKKVKDHYKDPKAAIQKAKNSITDLEDKDLNPLQKADTIYEGKMVIFINEQNRKIQDAAITQAAKDKKEKDARIKKARAKLEKFKGQVTDRKEQKDLHEKLLATGNVPDEEAEIMREEIRLIDIELGNIDKAAEGTMHRAEETTSVAPAVAAYIPPTGTSVKKLKIPQSVTDPQALLKAVYEKKVSINVIKWHLPAIKQELNSGRDVPGVYFTEETKVPQRAGRIK